MKTGSIGPGYVGGKPAGSILRNGHDLSVRDLDKPVEQPFFESGAHRAVSPRGMAWTYDMVITSPPSPSVCSAVTEEIFFSRLRDVETIIEDRLATQTVCLELASAKDPSRA